MPRVELPCTEIAPPPDLAPYVDRLWLRTTGHGAGRVHRVLPDGCVDVIVHVDRGSAELVGTMIRALEVAGGPAEMVAVRFRPAGRRSSPSAPRSMAPARSSCAIPPATLVTFASRET